MKALRLVINQTSANYKREETVDNKMTYPLPPFSTVIGALHNACGYREYKEMDISIQGSYESMHREPYTDYCFLNSIMDDRGILVKMKNGDMLSNAFEKVAAAKKPQGNSFRNNITIQVYNQELIEEYRKLKDLNDEIAAFKKKRLAPVMDLLKKRKKHLSEKKKKLEKKSQEYQSVVAREKELKDAEKDIKQRLKQFQEENYTIPISRYRSLTTSMKFYEILDGVRLILHVKASDEILEDILEHIYDLKSIGRSEDMVNVEDAQIVELYEKSEEEVISSCSAYIACEMVANGKIILDRKDGRNRSGTKYYLNKKYTIIGKKRIFEKVKALYATGYTADTFGNGLYLDIINGKKYIVNFL
jgi:CRISPR-associated protein Cas5t